MLVRVAPSLLEWSDEKVRRRSLRYRDLLGRTTECRCDPFNRRFGQRDVGSTSSHLGHVPQ